MNLPTVGTWWMWAAFLVFIVAMIGADILVLQGKGGPTRLHARSGGLVCALGCARAALQRRTVMYLDGVYGSAVANEKALEFLS